MECRNMQPKSNPAWHTHIHTHLLYREVYLNTATLLSCKSITILRMKALMKTCTKYEHIMGYIFRRENYGNLRVPLKCHIGLFIKWFMTIKLFYIFQYEIYYENNWIMLLLDNSNYINDLGGHYFSMLQQHYRRTPIQFVVGDC